MGSVPCRGWSTATRTRRSAAIACTSSRCAPAERATRSCTQRAAASSRPSRRRAPSQRTTCASGSQRMRAQCSGTGRQRGRGSPATASTATRSSRPSRLSAPRAEARRGWARTPCRRTPWTRTPTSTGRSPRCCPAQPSSPMQQMSSWSAARSTREQARRYLEACGARGLALRLHGDQFTESGAIPLAVELGARSVDHLEATGRGGTCPARRQRRGRRAAPGERALPRPADAGRAGARRCGCGDRARDRFQPGERIHDEPAARRIARLYPAPPRARGSTRRDDRQCGARPRSCPHAWATRAGLRAPT